MTILKKIYFAQKAVVRGTLVGIHLVQLTKVVIAKKRWWNNTFHKKARDNDVDGSTTGPATVNSNEYLDFHYRQNVPFVQSDGAPNDYMQTQLCTYTLSPLVRVR